MDIEIHCSGCGKLIRAPRETAGRWARCPACDRQLYIPTPSTELEELPLAPEDTTLLAREAELQAERHRLDRILNREREAPAGSSDAPARRTPAREPERTDIRSALIEYLRAMSRSELANADQLMATLRRERTEVLALLDRLAADQMPPAALGNIPSGVYQGFLKHLRMQLST